MKKLLPAFILAVLVLTAACTLFKKDIDIAETFTLDLNQAADAPLTFSLTQEVSTANADVEKYKEEIDQFDIKKITLKIKQFPGSNAPLVSGTLTFALAGTNDFKTLGSFDKINVKTLAASGEEVEVLNANDNGAAKQALVNAIKAGNNIVLKIDGNTSENPVVATLEVKVYATITVEI